MTSGRIRPILAQQVAWTETHKQSLEFVDRFYGAPATLFWGLAGAPYFWGGSERDNMSTIEVLSSLEASVNAYNDRYDFKELHRMIAYAVYYRLRPIAYEGGPDTYGDKNIPSKRAASLDARMRTISRKYLNDWYRNGGELFMWFVAGAGSYDHPWGTWPLTNDPDREDVAKVQAMDDVLNVAKPAVTAGKLLPAIQDAREFVACERDWQTRDPYLRDLDAGRTIDYLVRSATAREYKVDAMMASPNFGGKLELWVNNSKVGEFTCPNTGSWTSFGASNELRVNLPAGLSVLRLRAVSHRAYNVQSLRITAAATLPAAPTGLTATGGQRKITLVWSAPTGTGLTYNVYRATSAGAFSSKPQVSGITTTTFVDTTAVPGRTYFYCVTATNSVGEGPASNQVSGTATGSGRVR
jgi:hypothetical protein